MLNEQATKPEEATQAPSITQAPKITNDNMVNPADKSQTINLENTKDETTKPETTEDNQTPDWFMKDKFKSIDDQAKSYKELSAKMGKFWGSPQDNYNVEGIESIEPNDPLIEALTPGLKEMGVSQDGFQYLVSKYMDANKQMMKVMEDDLKKTLTSTDAHTYQAIDKWMTDSLTPEEATQIKNNWLMTAEDFKLFNNLRLMLAPSTNVPSAGVNPVKFETSKEVTNDKIKYKTELRTGTRVKDKNYEDQLAARFRDAAAREQRNKGR